MKRTILLIFVFTVYFCSALQKIGDSDAPPLLVTVGQENGKIFFEVSNSKSESPEFKDFHLMINKTLSILVAEKDHCMPVYYSDGAIDFIDCDVKYKMWDVAFENLESKKIYYGQRDHLDTTLYPQGPKPLEKGKVYRVQVYSDKLQRKAHGIFKY